MTSRKHFIVLAEELGEDKLYYRSDILFEEKYDRMVKYCRSINPRFCPDKFRICMLKHYNKKLAALSSRIGGTE